MKIVMEYIESDGATYSNDIIKAVECQSATEAEIQFEQALNLAEYEFQVFGHDFHRHNFDFGYRPTFLPLEAWFDNRLPKQRKTS